MTGKQENPVVIYAIGWNSHWCLTSTATFLLHSTILHPSHFDHHQCFQCCPVLYSQQSTHSRSFTTVKWQISPLMSLLFCIVLRAILAKLSQSPVQTCFFIKYFTETYPCIFLVDYICCYNCWIVNKESKLVNP